MDFSGNATGAARRIDDWAGEATAGRIPGLVTPDHIPPETQLLLTTAVYLNAAWRTPFDKVDADQVFTGPGGRRIKSDMMSLHAALQAARGPGWVAAALPYDEQRLESLVILPDSDLPLFEKSWTPQSHHALCDSLRERPVMLRMPQFDLRGEFHLEPALAAAGLPHLLTGADFTAMAGESDVAVSEMLQRVQLSVGQQQGSEPCQPYLHKPGLNLVESRIATGL